jgi:hypothetical protein
MENYKFTTNALAVYLAHNFVNKEDFGELSAIHFSFFDDGLLSVNAVDGHKCGSFYQKYTSDSILEKGFNLSVIFSKEQIKMLKEATKKNSDITFQNTSPQEGVLVTAGAYQPFFVTRIEMSFSLKTGFPQFYRRAWGDYKGNTADGTLSVPMKDLAAYDFSKVVKGIGSPTIRQAGLDMNIIDYPEERDKKLLPFEFLGVLMSRKLTYEEREFNIPQWCISE